MTVECPTCGALVVDRDRHRRWHLQLEELTAAVRGTVVDLRAEALVEAP